MKTKYKIFFSYVLNLIITLIGMAFIKYLAGFINITFAENMLSSIAFAVIWIGIFSMLNIQTDKKYLRHYTIPLMIASIIAEVLDFVAIYVSI